MKMKAAEEIQAVIDNLRRIFQVLNEYSKNAESKSGLTGPQLWAMCILGTGVPLRVSELARWMYLHPATVVGILDRLEKKGLVTRIRSKDDRRVVDLYLTDKGRELVDNAPETPQVMLKNSMIELSDEQFSCVAEGMKQMVRILESENFVQHSLHGRARPRSTTQNGRTLEKLS